MASNLEAQGSEETVTDLHIEEEIDFTKLILEKLQEIVPGYIERLLSIWNAMGISTFRQKARADAVIKYMEELLSEMVNDEINLLQDLQENTKKCEDELLHLSKLLGRAPCQLKENLSLVEKEKELRIMIEKWNSDKEERRKLQRDIREKEDVLCKKLSLPPHDMSIPSIATDAQLKEIEANVDFMQKELVRAKVKFQDLQEAIVNLGEELELDDNDKIYAEVAKESSDCFNLSKDSLLQLENKLKELEEKRKDNMEKGCKLRQRLESLWTKLEINEKDQYTFNANCVGSRPSAIKMLEDEVNKYEIMKLKHTKKFIIALRKELNDVWDKCYFGEVERKQFTPAFDNDFTEESLELHEHQVKIMRGYYEDNKVIFKMVEKRERMWKQLIDFEAQESDPTRLFSNRGGSLLKELTLKTSIEKNLPKAESELKSSIESWEKDNESYFLVNGKRYLEVMQSQQDERKRKKNLLKFGKKKERKEAIVKEMVYGSVPAKRTSSDFKHQGVERRRSVVNELRSCFKIRESPPYECLNILQNLRVKKNTSSSNPVPNSKSKTRPKTLSNVPSSSNKQKNNSYKSLNIKKTSTKSVVTSFSSSSSSSMSSSYVSTSSMTTKSSTTFSTPVSTATTAMAKGCQPSHSLVRKTKKKKRVSTKFIRHRFQFSKRRSVVQGDALPDEATDDEEEEVESYPDFTSRIKGGIEKGLSSTAASANIDSSDSDSN